jgi:hypothetical protein
MRVAYAHEGPETGAAAPSRSYADDRTALAALTGAIPAGDADEAEGALAWLLQHLPAGALISGIADAVIPALGAAAHAPILLAMFLREPRLDAAYGALLRAPVRYLSLQGAARLTWPTHAASPTDASADLAAVLLSPAHTHSPPIHRPDHAGGGGEWVGGEPARRPDRKRLSGGG